MQNIEWFSASKGSFKLDGRWEQHRVEISIAAGISVRMGPGSEDDPNLHGLAATRNVTRRKLLRRLEEQRPGMWMHRGRKRCWHL